MSKKTKTLLPGRDGVAQLANDLRNIAQVSNFIWDFSIVYKPHDCGTIGCAMGYVRVLYANVDFDGYIISLDKNLNGIDFENYLGLYDLVQNKDQEYYEPANEIFHRSAYFYPDKTYETVTPNDVADALERYLRETSDNNGD